MERCINCNCQLLDVYNDPDGDSNIECVKCRTEAEHNFDEDPGAKFDRSGKRVDVRFTIGQLVYLEGKGFHVEVGEEQLRVLDPDASLSQGYSQRYVLVMIHPEDNACTVIPPQKIESIRLKGETP